MGKKNGNRRRGSRKGKDGQGSSDQAAAAAAGGSKNGLTLSLPAPPHPWRPSSYGYKVDYNDHFETPLVAYQDILPLLLGVSQPSAAAGDGPEEGISAERDDEESDGGSGGRRRCYRGFRRPTVYDPYYCNGMTKRMLERPEMGFRGRVVHEKRDFYGDIERGTVPGDWDVLVTNPPYSDDHKERCLDFCIGQFAESSRPFFLLMPGYVAARRYYRDRLLRGVPPAEDAGEGGIGPTLSPDDVAYVVPSAPYSYEHPEGTGRPECPFDSLWFCGVGKENVPRLRALFDEHHGRLGKKGDGGDNRSSSTRPVFVSSLDGLERLGAISTERRANPRQRRKRRRERRRREQQGSQQSSLQQHPMTAGHASRPPTATAAEGGRPSKKRKRRDSPGLARTASTDPERCIGEKGGKGKKPFKKSTKSRYRDENGNRTKTRF